jgi:hypothetical protein
VVCDLPDAGLGRLVRCFARSIHAVSVRDSAAVASYVATFVSPLETRLNAVLTSEAMRSTPTHVSVVTALKRLFVIYSGLASAELAVEHSVLWTALFPVLELYPSVADTYHCDGPVSAAGLSFFLKFSDTHVSCVAEFLNM